MINDVSRLGQAAAGHARSTREPQESAPGIQGDQVSIGGKNAMPDHGCWDPRKNGVSKASAEWTGEPVRDDVKAVLGQLATSNPTGIVHTTRGLPPPPSIHQPQAPQPFSAGRFHAQFEDPKTGKGIGLVLETEQKVGHLGRVVPGGTDIGKNAYVALCADPKNSYKDLKPLGTGELDLLIDQLYARYKTPMTDAQADILQLTLNASYAVRYNGEGQAAVTVRHQQALHS